MSPKMSLGLQLSRNHIIIKVGWILEIHQPVTTMLTKTMSLCTTSTCFLNTSRPPVATATRSMQRDLNEAVARKEQQPHAMVCFSLSFFLPTSFLSLASQIRPCTSNQINDHKSV